jgi:hypothetical protein
MRALWAGGIPPPLMQLEHFAEDLHFEQGLKGAGPSTLRLLRFCAPNQAGAIQLTITPFNWPIVMPAQL